MFLLSKRASSSMEESGLENKTKWSVNIQFGRGIACLCVVISHFFQIKILGDYGVDLFFIISGFLMTSILVSEFDKYGRIRLLEFLCKRIRRLAPVAYVMIVVIIVMAWLGVIPGSKEDYFLLGFGYSLYLGNFFGLLPNSSNSTAIGFAHYWTLAAEMQLYLIWSIIIIPGIHFFKYSVKIASLIILTFVVLPLVTLLTREISQSIAHRTLEVTAMFTLGSFFYFLDLRYKVNRHPLVGILAFIVSISLILQTMTKLDQSHFFTIYNNLLLIGVLYQTVLILRSTYLLKCLAKVGDVSYSLYLIHWPIFLAIGGQAASIQMLVLGLAMSLILSILTFRYIESHFWKPKRV